MLRENHEYERIQERFWSHVDKSAGPDACWLWTGAKDHQGYGRFWMRGNVHRAHRVALGFEGITVVNGHVRHLCHNKLCVNPRHLEPGTPGENVHDSIANGTFKGFQRKVTDEVKAATAVLRNANWEWERIGPLFKVTPEYLKEVMSNKHRRPSPAANKVMTVMTHEKISDAPDNQNKVPGQSTNQPIISEQKKESKDETY